MVIFGVAAASPCSSSAHPKHSLGQLPLGRAQHRPGPACASLCKPQTSHISILHPTLTQLGSTAPDLSPTPSPQGP